MTDTEARASPRTVSSGASPRTEPMRRTSCTCSRSPLSGSSARRRRRRFAFGGGGSSASSSAHQHELLHRAAVHGASSPSPPPKPRRERQVQLVPPSSGRTTRSRRHGASTRTRSSRRSSSTTSSTAGSSSSTARASARTTSTSSQSFSQDDPYGLVVAPYAKLKDKIAATAWNEPAYDQNQDANFDKVDPGHGYVLTCSKFDKGALSKFKDKRRNKAGERYASDKDMTPGQ